MECGNPQHSHEADPGSRRTQVSIKDEMKEKIRPQVGSQLKDKKAKNVDGFDGPTQPGQSSDEAPVPDHLLPYLTGEKQFCYKVQAVVREEGTSEEAIKLALLTQFSAPPILSLFTGEAPMNTRSGPFWSQPPRRLTVGHDPNERVGQIIQEFIRTTPQEKYRNQDPNE